MLVQLKLLLAALMEGLAVVKAWQQPGYKWEATPTPTRTPAKAKKASK